MIVRFVDIGGMNDHHCLSFVFIITVTQSNLNCHDNIENKSKFFLKRKVCVKYTYYFHDE